MTEGGSSSSYVAFSFDKNERLDDGGLSSSSLVAVTFDDRMVTAVGSSSSKVAF